MSGIQIVNGHLIDPANQIDEPNDIFIEADKICAVGKAPDGFVATTTIDASDQIVCPGLVDLCAHLREPGEEYKATIASETAAAAKSGITTLCCPPDSNPVVDTPAVASMIQHRAERLGYARVLPIGALTKGLDGVELAEMAALQQAGCVALSNGRKPLANTLVERRALEYAATFGITAILPPEDQFLRADGCAHEGPVSARLGLPGIPKAAETVAMARDIALAAHTGCHVHFRGLSTATAVKMMARSLKDKLPVTADVAAHQLHLTENDLMNFDSNCHLNPPLRSEHDRDRLRQGVADGTISAICSDHQPHDQDAKEAPFSATAPGMSALETLLALTLKLVEDGVLTLPQAIARITSGPADILSLPLGRLGIGSSADICIFDPKQSWTLNPAEMVSQGQNTPFINHAFNGQVTHTILQGRVVYTA